MAISDRELKRLILQIERDLLAQARLRALLSAADTTVADRRQELRKVEARIEHDNGGLARRKRAAPTSGQRRPRR